MVGRERSPAGAGDPSKEPASHAREPLLRAQPCSAELRRRLTRWASSRCVAVCVLTPKEGVLSPWAHEHIRVSIKHIGAVVKTVGSESSQAWV